MAYASPHRPDASAARVVALAGATGLVGRAILEGLLADASVAAVHALGRREPKVSHPKLTAHVVDFESLPTLPRLNEVYLSLGTTIKAAGSQAAFRAVDFDANLSCARDREVGVEVHGAEGRLTPRCFDRRAEG